MVQINMASKEITLKVVYYGPALSGKVRDPLRRSSWRKSADFLHKMRKMQNNLNK